MLPCQKHASYYTPTYPTVAPTRKPNKVPVPSSSHQSVTDPKQTKMPYTQLQILNYLTVTKRLKNTVTPPTSPDCLQQHHHQIKISKPAPRSECRLVLHKMRAKKSGQKVLVFKAAGPNKRVGACGLGSCSVCGKFLGKFSCSPCI
jgi:hypothetical protein